MDKGDFFNMTHISPRKIVYQYNIHTLKDIFLH